MRLKLKKCGRALEFSQRFWITSLLRPWSLKGQSDARGTGLSLARSRARIAHEITIAISHFVRLLRQPLFVSTVEASPEFIGQRRCAEPGKKEILITFVAREEEDKSLIIHAKRGSPCADPRRVRVVVPTCAYARRSRDAPATWLTSYTRHIYLISTYRERDKSRGVRWTMVIS